MEQEWAHLEPLVAALVQAGNQVIADGFRPTQGGFECALRNPLDPEIVRPMVGTDDRLNFDEGRDEVTCRHCWAIVYGGSATARYRREHEEALERRNRP